ncbi:MAG: 2-oxo acid dehydrogenase subunit E2 [Anaerolineales bacterium]
MVNQDFELTKFPAEREIVVDAGYMASGRHIIFALIELDVTDPLKQLKTLSNKIGRKISFTAFIIASFSQAIMEYPRVHGFLDWRKRLVTFRDVDVVTMIEPQPGAVAIPHIIRSANQLTVLQISDEIRSVQTHPGTSGQSGGLVQFAPKLPRIVRLLYFRMLKLNPHWLRQMAGTVIITSVGMFGKSGGWGIGFLPTHNLGITVGGISQKPGVKNGEILIREYLGVTLAFDHDIIDGAPAARFTSIFAGLIESGAALKQN